MDATKRGMSIRQTAINYGVPPGILRDKLRNKYRKHMKGPSSILTANEEARIVDWLKLAACTGFPVTEKQLKISLAQFVRLNTKATPFNNGIPGRKWITLFKHISLRKPSVLAKHRATITEPQIRNWFQEVHYYLTEEELESLLNQLERIFNLDSFNRYLHGIRNGTPNIVIN